MTIPLQTGIVYGPIESRRFGRSLGVNLLPTGKKLCNFDCTYCQYGAAIPLEDSFLPSCKEIEEALEEFSSDPGGHLDWIMISGNGEPTLHPDFPAIVDELKKWRDHRSVGVPIGVLSNSSTCHRPVIQDTLAKLDGRFMKLDAGNERIFWRMNKPDHRWADIITGLFHLKKVVIQSLFVQGGVDNISPESLDDWMQTVAYIHPEKVQIYTLDRPPKDEGLESVSFEKLQEIRDRLVSERGISAEVFSEKKA